MLDGEDVLEQLSILKDYVKSVGLPHFAERRISLAINASSKKQVLIMRKECQGAFPASKLRAKYKF